MSPNTLEELKKMKSQGLSEDQIIKALRDKGVPHKDILEALSHSKIKAAVEQPEPEPQDSQPQPPQPSPDQDYNSASTAGMEQSIMTQQASSPPPQMDISQSASQPQEFPEPPTPSQAPQDTQDYNPYPQYSPQSYDQYPEYEQYQSYQPTSYSSDMISEISEQVVSEKLAEIRKGVEKIIDFKTTTETKIETLSERLQRLEKIIDTLQSSVLRKVGDYVTNIDDIKREMIETQKTFSKLLPEMKKSHSKKHKKSSKK